MILDKLTTEEQKCIFIKLFEKVETNKSLIVATVKYNNVEKIGDEYIMNLYNGYEHKTCSISAKGVFISSESMLTNQELTKFYKKMLKNILAKKKFEEVQQINEFNQSI